MEKINQSNFSKSLAFFYSLKKKLSNIQIANLIELRWTIFLFFSGWLLLTPSLLKYLNKKNTSSFGEKQTNTQNLIHVLLEQEKSPPTLHNQKSFLSNQNQKSSGKITRDKEFESTSNSDTLSFAPQKTEPVNKKVFELGNIFISFPKKGSKLNQIFNGSARRNLIPSHYKFQNRLAFSFDEQGEPVIPTIHIKHYKYFRNMLRKIKNHWAPPGGQPYPTHQYFYHSLTSAPGFFRHSTFSSQIIKTVYRLDQYGNVTDVKIIQSLQDSALDQSVLEAIIRSKNFDPPPKNLLKNGYLNIPLKIVIIVH